MDTPKMVNKFFHLWPDKMLTKKLRTAEAAVSVHVLEVWQLLFMDSRQPGSLACWGPGRSFYLPFCSNNRCLAPTDICYHKFLSTQDPKMLSGSILVSSRNFSSFTRHGQNPRDLSAGCDLGSKFQGKMEHVPFISNFSFHLYVTQCEMIAFYHFALEWVLTCL